MAFCRRFAMERVVWKSLMVRSTWSCGGSRGCEAARRWGEVSCSWDTGGVRVR